MYVSFIIMFGLAAIANPLFYVLFGEKWAPAVPIFQALCLAYAIAPMHIINHNILKVKGRADLVMKTEIIKYIFITPFLILGIVYGMKVLIAGIVLFYWIGYFFNSMYTKKLINFSFLAQCRDFLPFIVLSGIPAIFVFGIGLVLPFSPFPLLAIQAGIYIFMTIGLSLVFKVSAFFEIVGILRNKFTIINMIKTLKNT